MLSNEASARLCSHVARLNTQLPQIVGDVVNALAPAFPGVKACVPMNTPQQRFETTSAAAYVCKNIGNLNAIESWLEMMGEAAGDQGFDADAAQQALAWAIVDGVRRNAGDDWSGELEDDWRQLGALVARALARGAHPAARTTHEFTRLAA